MMRMNEINEALFSKTLAEILVGIINANTVGLQYFEARLYQCLSASS